MNARTSYVLIAILVAVGTMSISSAFALEQACPDCGAEGVITAKEALLREVPVSVWTDGLIYNHESAIRVDGQVANIRVGTPITLTVISPFNNIVTIDQLFVDSNGMFSTTLSTAGNLWKYDGTYTIRVQYGDQAVNNKAVVQLTDGIKFPQDASEPTVGCGSSELSATGACVPFSISGATVTDAWFSTDTNSLTVKLRGADDGTLTVDPSSDAIRGIFMVLVDGQEWDDVDINGNEVTVMFPAGTEEIEIIGTFAIPEFGAIAALILAVAIISIIVVSAKTRLRVMPKF